LGLKVGLPGIITTAPVMCRVRCLTVRVIWSNVRISHRQRFPRAIPKPELTLTKSGRSQPLEPFSGRAQVDLSETQSGFEVITLRKWGSKSANSKRVQPLIIAIAGPRSRPRCLTCSPPTLGPGAVLPCPHLRRRQILCIFITPFSDDFVRAKAQTSFPQHSKSAYDFQ